MKKVFAAVMVAALAGVGWYMLQPVVLRPAAGPLSADNVSVAEPRDGDSPSATAPVLTPAQLSPYADCPSSGSHAVDTNKSLMAQLYPLLQAGKTPAELLQFDMQNAIWPMGYAESIAQVQHLIGYQALQVKAPEILADFVARLDQLSAPKDVLDFSRRLAEDEDFQVFVSRGLFGNKNGSMLQSPSLEFMQLAAYISFDEFKQLIAGKTFAPVEIAMAMQWQLPEQYLLQLLQQGRDLDQFPAGYHSMQALTPAWNLADVAAMHWQPAVLKALKQQGIVPSSMEGIVTGLDFALFTEPHRLPEVRDTAERQQRLKQAQRETVAYLLAEGYWAHGHQLESGNWYFGNNFINTSRFDNDEILALLPATGPAKVFRRAELTPQPVPAGTALADWVAQQKQAKAQAQQARQQCLTGKQQFISTEALLSRNAVQKQIFAWRDGKPAAEQALAPLHQRDPAWVAWHWQMGGAWQPGTDETLRDQLTDLLNDPAELMAFLQKTELDSGTTAWLLMEVMTKPDLVPAFEQRFAPKAPAYLYPGYGFKPEQDFKALLEAGFDLAIEDLYGRNFFHWAFQTSPATVLLLLNEGLSPFAQAMGPDALDLALEHSYLQRYLHPALPLILPKLTDAEPSHLARLKRLQMYRPELYRAVLQLKPDLQLPADIQPNELLCPPGF